MIDKKYIAAAHLLGRPNHMSSQEMTEGDSWDDKSTHVFFTPTNDNSVAAHIELQSYFQWMNAVYVNPKRLDTNIKPVCINLFVHHTSNRSICFSGYQNSHRSVTKAEIALPPNRAPEHDYVRLLLLNGGGEYRVGSLLVQMAIEYSIQQGCDGRVTLRSTHDSGQFYFKLGFIPVNDVVYSELLMGQQVNRWDMYLPDSSISIWKDKIYKRPILTRPIQKQLVEDMWVHDTSTRKLWPFLIDKLSLNALKSVSFDYVCHYKSMLQSPDQDLLWAFKNNTSLEAVCLKGSTFEYPLAALIKVLSSHRNLSSLTIRNYDERINEIDTAAFEALASVVLHVPRLKKLTLAHLTLRSHSFIIFCEALTHTSLVKDIAFFCMSLSTENVGALKDALLSNRSITTINSFDCERSLESMLVEVRGEKISAVRQAFFSQDRTVPPIHSADTPMDSISY